MNTTPGPADTQAAIRADLIRRGRLIPASDLGPPALPSRDPDLSIDSTDVVSDLREDRL